MGRLLLLSDTQLDARSSLLPAGERLADQSRMLEEIAGAAMSRAVDAVVFCGDAFQHRRPVPAELLAFQRFARALEHSKITLLAVAGNHDWAGVDQPIALDLFYGPYVRTFKTPFVFNVGELAIAMLPWAPAASMLATQVERDLVDVRVAERLVDVAEGLIAQIETTQPTLLVAHWMLSGSAFPSGLPVSQAREPILPVRDLVAQGWDFIVAGHVHRQQLLDDDLGITTPVAVCGSPWVCDFGEADLEHGFWILDTADGLEFHPILSDRRFVTIDVPELVGADGDQIADVIVSAITLPIDDAVVRVRFTVTEEQLAHVDVDAIRRFVDDAGGRLHEIRPTVLRTSRARAAGADDQIGPLDALELYMDASDASPSLRQPMRDRTSTYLEATR